MCLNLIMCYHVKTLVIKRMLVCVLFTGMPPPPSGGGMVMMQLTLPPAQQPRPHSPSQWKHHKYHSLDQQRSQKSTDLCSLDSSYVSPACTWILGSKNQRGSGQTKDVGLCMLLCPTEHYSTWKPILISGAITGSIPHAQRQAGSAWRHISSHHASVF